MKNKIRIGLLLFSFTVFSCPQIALAGPPAPASSAVSAAAEKFIRTELYFGRSKPDGSTVTDDEWAKFLTEVVTPRFPDGFTVLEGYGQFRDASGKIVKEKSLVLVLFYSSKLRKPTSQKVDEIRAAYKKEFQQQSVLRLDFRESVRVSF